MLASRVTFLPQLRGVLPKALAPLRDQAYSGESETLAPISSTNTRRSASTFPATSILQAAFRNSSRSPAPSDLFSAPPQAPEHPTHGGLAERETAHPRYSHRSERVAAGRSSMSASNSLLAL